MTRDPSSRLHARARFFQAVREFYTGRGFLEEVRRAGCGMESNDNGRLKAAAVPIRECGQVVPIARGETPADLFARDLFPFASS